MRNKMSQLLWDESKILNCLFSHVDLTSGWILGSTCKKLWQYVLYEWEPRQIRFHPRILFELRHSKSPVGGRSDIWFSNKAFSSFLARVSKNISVFIYQKHYKSDSSWRYHSFDLDSKLLPCKPGEFSHEEDVESRKPYLDTHLSMMDLAIILIASRQSLEILDLTANVDMSNVHNMWYGLPPLEHPDWYLLCPYNFPPRRRECSGCVMCTKDGEQTGRINLRGRYLPTLSMPLTVDPAFDFSQAEVFEPSCADIDFIRRDSRIGCMPRCISNLSLPRPRILGLPEELDPDDHMRCCDGLERLIYFTGMNLSKAESVPWSGRLTVTERIPLEFPKLRELYLRSPNFGVKTGNFSMVPTSWQLLCLLRGLQFQEYPNLTKMTILGRLTIPIKEVSVGHTSARELLNGDQFRRSSLFARDMINLYLLGEIPVVDDANFVARRYLRACYSLYLDQQRFWRSILETKWLSTPKLRHFVISGYIDDMKNWPGLPFLAESPIYILEFHRTFNDPTDVWETFGESTAISGKIFPSVRYIWVRKVNGVETLLTIQRLFSVLLGRAIIAQTQKLVINPNNIYTENIRLHNWVGFYQSRFERLPNNLDDPNWKCPKDLEFFIQGRPSALILRFSPEEEKKSNLNVETQILGLIPGNPYKYLSAIRENRGTIQDLDYVIQNRGTRPSQGTLDFENISDLMVDIGPPEFFEGPPDAYFSDETLKFVASVLLWIRMIRSDTCNCRIFGDPFKPTDFRTVQLANDEPIRRLSKEKLVAREVEACRHFSTLLHLEEAPELNDIKVAEGWDNLTKTWTKKIPDKLRDEATLKAFSDSFEGISRSTSVLESRQSQKRWDSREQDSSDTEVFDSDSVPSLDGGVNTTTKYPQWLSLGRNRGRVTAGDLQDTGVLISRVDTPRGPSPDFSTAPPPVQISSLEHLEFKFRYRIPIHSHENRNVRITKWIGHVRKWTIYNPTLAGIPSSSVRLITTPKIRIGGG